MQKSSVEEGKQRDRKHYFQVLFVGLARSDGRKLAAEVGVCKATILFCLYEGCSGNEHIIVPTNSQARRARRQVAQRKIARLATRIVDSHMTLRRHEEYPGLCEAVAKTIVGECAEVITNEYV